MERKSNFVKCLLFGMLVGAVVWVTGCGDLLGIDAGVQNTIAQVATGTQEWDAYDTFEFRTQKLYKRDSDSPVTSGDIYLVPAASTTQLMNNSDGDGTILLAEWLAHSIVKLNARAVYNAGENSDIDCRTAYYNTKLLTIKTAQGKGRLLPIDKIMEIIKAPFENYIMPTTICINTQEGNIAKVVFHNQDISSFDWTYYPTPYKKNEEIDPNNYEIQILEELNKKEWVGAIISLKNEHSLGLKPNELNEVNEGKKAAVWEQKEEINRITIESVFRTLSDDEFIYPYQYKPSFSSKFSGELSKKGFEKLIKNPMVKMIYWGDRPIYPMRWENLF